MKGGQSHDQTVYVIICPLLRICTLVHKYTGRCRTSCVPALRPRCTRSCPGICMTSPSNVSQSHGLATRCDPCAAGMC